MKYALAGAGLALAACSNGQQTAAETAPKPTPAAHGDADMSNTGTTVHRSDFRSIRGEPLPLADFEGKVVLVVNTASRCGYTGQYAGLQELHDAFADKGFTVLGAPSNDFGAQEPGTEAEILSFCELNYGVDFPLTEKVRVTGPERHAFWQAAVSTLGDAAEPRWNFHKILVGRDGRVLSAYPSAVRPADAELVADIEAALAAG